jgi:deoxyribodipyrimidine photo-lyase
LVNPSFAGSGARVPDARIRLLNERGSRANGRYVLYWTTSARRLDYNFGLQRAVEACLEFRKPLVIFEAVRCDYPEANDRLHRFLLDGMAEHAGRWRARPFATYRMSSRLAPRARDCSLRSHPLPRPWSPTGIPRFSKGDTAVLPPSIDRQWPTAEARLSSGTLASLPIDHAVRPAGTRGGAAPARPWLSRFLSGGLLRYDDEHNQPEHDSTSRLSPWLHFGHLSAHEVFTAVAKRERWSARRSQSVARGAREGWWNMSPAAEAFLDELITWRELAFNMCESVQHFDRFEALPPWARRTLDDHRRERRPHRYSIEAFELATTTRCGTRFSGSCAATAGSMATCGCVGKEDLRVVPESRARPRR